MAKLSVVKGATSVIVRIFIQDTSSTSGGGLTGLAFNTSGLVCYRARDDDGNAGGTAIALATMTRGTWASGGFIEKDSSNQPGIYEFGVTNAGLVTGSRSLTVMLKGAANMAPLTFEIELTGNDNQDAVRGGMTALPNVASGSAGAILVDGTGTAAISTSAGKLLLQSTQTGVTIPTVTNVTNQLTAAQIATGIFQDTTAGDFTAAGSIGKSIMNGVALGTGLTINAYTGNTPQTGDSFARLGAAGAGLTALGDTRIANLDAAVTSRMATYTQPSGFLAATFPTAVASPTNITGGTIANVTNNVNAVLANTAHGGAAATIAFSSMAGVATAANGNCVTLTGVGTGDGLRVVGGVTGSGLHAMGGATSGYGLYAEAQGGNFNGFRANGQGSGAGSRHEGGATGNGMSILGGSAGGSGLAITALADVNCLVLNSGAGYLYGLLYKWDTMLVLSGVVYQYTANALALSPSGSATVLPIVGSVTTNVSGTTITVYIGDTTTIVIGTDTDLSAKTLTFVVEASDGTDVATVANGSITKTSTTLTFAIPSAATTYVRDLHWSIRDATSTYLQGILQVLYAAKGD